MNSQPSLFSEDKTCSCKRCGVKCRVTGPASPEATLLRLSEEPKGVCVNCCVTEFLMNSYPLNMQLEDYGPEILLHPGMTEQFTPLMQVHHAQANPEEINWELVVRNWHLPVKVKRGPTNPWSPGDALAMKLEEMEFMPQKVKILR